MLDNTLNVQNRDRVDARKGFVQQHEQRAGGQRPGNFYAAPAQYMIGGDTWEKWYKAIATTVVKSIKKEGDIYRWDASGRGGVGPIYTTAVYTTMLAMPYHYLPLYQR